MTSPPERGLTLAIGLTGGIASGKSHVAGLFERLGVPVLDADQAARQVVAPGMPALERIVERFGRGALVADGSLDRASLREIVFADESARRDLEAITHPAIRDRIRAWRILQQPPYCILVNAILVQSGMTALIDRVLVVDAPVEVQIDRLLRRDSIDEPAARRMLAAQAGRDARLSVADDIIGNAEEDATPLAAVMRLHRLYRRLGKRVS